ncbi:hypothetical protein PRJBM_00638 [Bartonella henselae]|nr:hypothetical protein Q654_00087 [Bartonella henselae JK 50]ETS10323.1 hypothetical protein Q655_00038 [Bartonella henselae JK 51]CDO40024.1 hypothetical protein PRJBM_00638 [Bartonella henselae]CUH90598.1 hypothetical protein BM1374164_00638 [Bartonella henselae]
MCKLLKSLSLIIGLMNTILVEQIIYGKLLVKCAKYKCKNAV